MKKVKAEQVEGISSVDRPLSRSERRNFVGEQGGGTTEEPRKMLHICLKQL